MSNNNLNGFVIGVTGGIACGKSEVGRILGDMGFAVLDTDVLAHELMRQGTPVHERIVSAFGSGILLETGGISRPDLGRIVFSDPAKRTLLNELIHPAVRERLDSWISEKRSKNLKAAGLVPLLFESGMHDLDWNGIVCVSSLRELVLQRLAERGLNDVEAMQRINSQMPLMEKEKRADHVIRNNGTLGDLERAVREAVKAVNG